METPHSNPPTLLAAEARGVLGQYSHSINIDDGFAILYGPNGVGKTKFLEMIHLAISINGQALARLPFDSVTLQYSDNSQLFVERVLLDPGRHIPGAYRPANVKFTYSLTEDNRVEWVFLDDGFYEWASTRTRFDQMSDGTWVNATDGESVSTEELLEIYSRRPGSRRREAAPLPTELQNIKSARTSWLIKTQRLESVEKDQGAEQNWRPSSRTRKKRVSSIEVQSERIKTLLQEAQTEHSRVAQKLDRTFPHRVLSANEYSGELDPNSIRERFADQDELRSRIGKIASSSIRESFPLPDAELKPWALNLLDLYIIDADEKLNPFKPILARIELLEEILNDRLLRKRVEVSDEDGLRVVDTETGEAIPLDLLSSGEQHEIILMTDLLFRVPPGAVVLVDEPEISLHVAWQLAFVPDVSRIANLVKFNFVVATHSPQIIDDEWEKAIRLGPTVAAF